MYVKTPITPITFIDMRINPHVSKCAALSTHTEKLNHARVSTHLLRPRRPVICRRLNIIVVMTY